MEIAPGTIVYWYIFPPFSYDIMVGIVEKKLQRNRFRIKALFPEYMTSMVRGPRRKDFLLLSEMDSEAWEMMKSDIARRMNNLRKTLDFIQEQKK